MTEVLRLLLIALAVVAGLMAIQFFVLLVRLLRVPVHPLRLEPLPSPPLLPPDQAAALAELEALGFVNPRWSELDNGFGRVHVAMLCHRSTPACAELTFHVAGNLSGYAVSFHSLLAGGKRLVTTNRMIWSLLVWGPESEVEDAWADDLAAHWQTHLTRLEGRETISADPETMQRVLVTRAEYYFDLLREGGHIHRVDGAWHYTLKAAARIDWDWFRERRRLARPYRTDAITGDNETHFFTRFYLQMEAFQERMAPRRDVKAWVLALSAIASLIGWGLLFGWTQAVALVAIVLIHETGHAVAMRAFGYRHMHMFFVPFMGAIVTGVPGRMAAWKQALVLLAGPLPGLLAGAAALLWLGDEAPVSGALHWQPVAAMAVWINLFNLLPISPLDGGQLLDLALFSRWPRVRLVFVLLSVLAFVGLALLLEGPLIWALTFIVLLSMVGQWRIARLQGAWREGLDHGTQVRHLFEFARSRFKLRGTARYHHLLTSVFSLQRITRPRLWESALLLLLFVALWSSVAMVFIDGNDERPPREETRSVEQIAFDHAWKQYVIEEGEMGVEELALNARALPPDDPRRVDFAMEAALTAEDGARRAQLEQLLRQGRDGHYYALPEIAATLLQEHLHAAPGEEPLRHAVRLEREVERVMAMAPAAYTGTVAARLRIAEAFDRGGDPARAVAELDELDRTVTDGHERWALVEARSWFHLSHQAPMQAIGWLEKRVEPEALHGANPAANAYAWALLEAGRTEEGLERMKTAVYPRLRRRTFVQRLTGAAREPLAPMAPADLAYGLLRAGHEAEARRILEQSPWECWRAGLSEPGAVTPAPWQAHRERALWETAKALCPKREAACPPGGSQP